MRTAVVKGPRSKLFGKPCSASFCKRPVGEGEVVVWRSMPNDFYAEDLFVTHVVCMQAILDAAPKGRRPRNDEARAVEIRRAVEEGELFPSVV